MKQLNEKIRELREDSDTKQSVIAHYLGVTQQTYSNYETGQREIPISVVLKLAKYYKVSTDYLLGSDTSYMGNINMNANYIGGITLHDIVYGAQCLNKLNRKQLADFIKFLNLENSNKL